MILNRNPRLLQHQRLQRQIGEEDAVAGVEKGVDAAMALVGVEGVVDPLALLL